MTYQTEFPDFPEADMPAIPQGFEDTSWRNEGCPHFMNAKAGLEIWVDYADPTKSELPEHRAEGSVKRFALYRVNVDDEGVYLDDAREILAEADDWNEVLAAIIGEQFAAIIREVTTPAELAQIKVTNRGHIGDGICATHDIMDANEQMADAFQRLGQKDAFAIGHDDEAAHEAACILWGKAWDYAKAKHLTDTSPMITFAPDEPPCSLEGFFLENADGIDEEERAAIRTSLAQWGNYHGGGGAAAEFELRLVEDTSLHAEFVTWVTKEGYPEDGGGDAEDIMHHPHSTPERQAWLKAFIGRWEAVEAEAREVDDARQVAEQFTAAPTLAEMFATRYADAIAADQRGEASTKTSTTLLRRLRDEVKDWEDALCGERPSLTEICAEVDAHLGAA